MVAAEVFGLPSPGGVCGWPVFAFHIHSGGSCTGHAADPFAGALTHFNPGNCAHPAHAGDLPPLFGNGGHAVGLVLTDRFTVREIVGKAVIVHANRDDFTTQPSGDAGKKSPAGRLWPAACGSKKPAPASCCFPRAQLLNRGYHAGTEEGRHG